METLIINESYKVIQTDLFLDVQSPCAIQFDFVNTEGEVIVENNTTEDIILFAVGNLNIDSGKGFSLKAGFKVSMYGSGLQWRRLYFELAGVKTLPEQIEEWKQYVDLHYVDPAQIEAWEQYFDSHNIDISNLTQGGKNEGFVVANADGSNLTSTDYDALPISKETDNKLYFVFEG